MKLFVLIFLILGLTLTQTTPLPKKVEKRTALESAKADISPKASDLKDEARKSEDSKTLIPKVEDLKVKKDKINDKIKDKTHDKTLDKIHDKLKDNIKDKTKDEKKDVKKDELRPENDSEMEEVDREKKSCKTVKSQPGAPNKICLEFAGCPTDVQLCEDNEVPASSPLGPGVQQNDDAPQNFVHPPLASFRFAPVAYDSSPPSSPPSQQTAVYQIPASTSPPPPTPPPSQSRPQNQPDPQTIFVIHPAQPAPPPQIPSTTFVISQNPSVSPPPLQNRPQPQSSTSYQLYQIPQNLYSQQPASPAPQNQPQPQRNYLYQIPQNLYPQPPASPAPQNQPQPPRGYLYQIPQNPYPQPYPQPQPQPLLSTIGSEIPQSPQQPQSQPKGNLICYYQTEGPSVQTPPSQSQVQSIVNNPQIPQKSFILLQNQQQRPPQTDDEKIKNVIQHLLYSPNRGQSQQGSQIPIKVQASTIQSPRPDTQNVVRVPTPYCPCPQSATSSAASTAASNNPNPSATAANARNANNLMFGAQQPSQYQQQGPIQQRQISSNQQSAFSFQQPAMSYQPPAMSYQPPGMSYQLPRISNPQPQWSDFQMGGLDNKLALLQGQRLTREPETADSQASKSDKARIDQQNLNAWNRETQRRGRQ